MNSNGSRAILSNLQRIAQKTLATEVCFLLIATEHAYGSRAAKQPKERVLTMAATGFWLDWEWHSYRLRKMVNRRQHRILREAS